MGVRDKYLPSKTYLSNTDRDIVVPSDLDHTVTSVQPQGDHNRRHDHEGDRDANDDGDLRLYVQLGVFPRGRERRRQPGEPGPGREVCCCCCRGRHCLMPCSQGGDVVGRRPGRDVASVEVIWGRKM